MCFHLSLLRDYRELEQRFESRFDEPASYKPFYYEEAFSTPRSPVITDAAPDSIRMLEWGLIPRWVKSEPDAAQIRMGTFNARSDSVFSKASFRSSIMDRRCLVLADGFFEWHEHKGKKYPYYIRLKSRQAFALAGLWESWTALGPAKETFSIITTDANPLMAQIHNVKKRMPVILRREDEQRWLQKGLTAGQVSALLKPYDEGDMEAYTISRLITSRTEDRNVPKLLEPHEYKELGSQQRSLF